MPLQVAERHEVQHDAARVIDGAGELDGAAEAALGPDAASPSLS